MEGAEPEDESEELLSDVGSSFCQLLAVPDGADAAVLDGAVSEALEGADSDSSDATGSVLPDGEVDWFPEDAAPHVKSSGPEGVVSKLRQVRGANLTDLESGSRQSGTVHRCRCRH